MIRLAFIGPQRKIIRFEIDGKVVKYFDELWKEGIQVYPLDQTIINRLTSTKSGNLRVMAALILDANRGKDLEDYNSCESEEDISNFIKKDCKSKGLLLAR